MTCMYKTEHGSIESFSDIHTDRHETWCQTDDCVHACIQQNIINLVTYLMSLEKWWKRRTVWGRTQKEMSAEGLSHTPTVPNSSYTSSKLRSWSALRTCHPEVRDSIFNSAGQFGGGGNSLPPGFLPYLIFWNPVWFCHPNFQGYGSQPPLTPGGDPQKFQGTSLQLWIRHIKNRVSTESMIPLRFLNDPATHIRVGPQPKALFKRPNLS